ncbi:MAG: bi-domain-containing oxidoreductase [Actinomycetota bacterium]|nr:bi-domain-containing oxidoreductase [Actinomycetota bacterium]
MKQVVQNYRSGELSVLDVPMPACKPGGVLVRSRYSLISTGTELMKVAEARLSLIGKARARPDQVRKVVDSAAQLGPAAAYKKAMARLDSYTPLGYSLSGIVTEVGRGAEEFHAGQLVACAGNEHALHAEVNWVPTNLCVPVPEGVDAHLAAFATVGAIAMHGVRRAEVQVGEFACVIGLGLIGQLVVQVLNAAGVRVVGFDPVEERCRVGEAAGALVCAPPTEEGIARVEQALSAGTAGLGADHVFLAAGGSSNDPVHLAARIARDRARVVDIGKTRLDLPWNEYYEKELEVRFSRSYGPGRYDDRYEIQGVDYPAGYVRWTERRNLACFLDLLARGELNLEPLVTEVFPVENAVEVYGRLDAGELRGVGFLFEYRYEGGPQAEKAPPPAARPVPALRPPLERGLRLGFIGAGNYASSMLLPHLASREDVELAHLVTATSVSAVNGQRRFGFVRASTDVADVIDDCSIDAVFVVTRHNSHADLTCRALQAGRAVFVEKPLALTDAELDRVLEVIAATGNDRLMVGFNRRFAPLFVELKSRFRAEGAPGVVRYLVNAGPLPKKSWYSDAETEGSRFTGEGGHFIDTVSWWFESLPQEVHAVAASGAEDLVATLRFHGGSVASIVYTGSGNPRYPKEMFEASAGSRTARLDNFRRAAVWVGRRRHARRSIAIDKGQRPQLERFLQAVRSGGPMPIPLESLVATTRATLAVDRSQASGLPQTV